MSAPAGEPDVTPSPLFPFAEPGSKQAVLNDIDKVEKAVSNKPSDPAQFRRKPEIKYAGVRYDDDNSLPVAIAVTARGSNITDALAEFEKGVSMVRVQARALIQLEEQRVTEAAAHERKKQDHLQRGGGSEDGVTIQSSTVESR